MCAFIRNWGLPCLGLILAAAVLAAQDARKPVPGTQEAGAARGPDGKEQPPAPRAPAKSLEQALDETNLPYDKIQRKGSPRPYFRITFTGGLVVYVEELRISPAYSDGEPKILYLLSTEILRFREGEKPTADVIKKIHDINMKSIFGWCFCTDRGIYFKSGFLARGMHPEALRNNIGFMSGDGVRYRQQLTAILKAIGEEGRENGKNREGRPATAR